MKTPHLAAAALSALAATAWADAPQYSIVDLGVVASTTASQAFGISPDGDTVVGRSLGSSSIGNIAYAWTEAGGLQSLANLSGRKYAVANAVNDAGTVVGVSATTAFGSSPLPVMWQNGVATQLALPSGYAVGQAYAINAGGTIVGAVGSGIQQRAAILGTSSTTVISATTANGSYMSYAYGITNSGLVIGAGIDPSNAAVNVGLIYDTVSGSMTSLGALPGLNGAIAFGVSDSGYVVGASMFNQGSGLPFIWSASGGMTAIPLPDGTTAGSARDVNDSGWAVGVASNAYAIPFLYADGTTYSIDTLLTNGAGWDLVTNTSSSALGIANDGSIIGTAIHDGAVHAYKMTLVTAVPEPGTWALLASGLGLLALRRRRPTQH